MIFDGMSVKCIHFHLEEIKKMSIKKELLDELTINQLKELAEDKGIKFSLTKEQKKYYYNWDERDKLVDLMTDQGDLSVKEIEKYIKTFKNL